MANSGQTFGFKIEKKSKRFLARAGVITTPHGEICTPAFVAVGTKGTVKALSPEAVAEAGIEVVLANTFHLYLEPGEKSVKKAGGLGSYMNWNRPTMTDSGGFQVFSLGLDFEKKAGKISFDEKTKKKDGEKADAGKDTNKKMLAEIDEEGVSFKSPLDGSRHRFTPEKSIAIQNDIGADMIFAFDECPPSDATREYQAEAMDRTHRWAKRSLLEHRRLQAIKRKKGESEQAIFGIVQGGNFADLRGKSAGHIGKMDFDGFGIGGTFNKKDIGKVVAEVNRILPEEKPRHLLGIGEPDDLKEAIKSGCDLFDCVAPTRMGRNGALYAKKGRINILNAKFRNDFSPIEKGCGCYVCKNYTKAYIAHLFRAKEMFGATLASIHNLYFLAMLVKEERRKIYE